MNDFSVCFELDRPSQDFTSYAAMQQTMVRNNETDLPWKKWSRLSERIRLIQTLIEGGKNEPQTQTRTDHQFAA